MYSLDKMKSETYGTGTVERDYYCSQYSQCQYKTVVNITVVNTNVCTVRYL